MNIKISHPPGGLKLVQLSAGDVFVRNAAQRPWEDRAVYMLLHQHSRFSDLRQYKSTSRDLVVVNMGTGRLDSMDRGQLVVQLDADCVHLPIKRED